MKHILNLTYRLLFLLIILQSCDKEKGIIQEITKDSLLISNSSKEIIANYDKCITNFGKSRNIGKLEKVIRVEISNSDLKYIEILGLKNTKELLKKNYEIKIDASKYYRILFEKKVEERTFGVTRYSVLYDNNVKETKGIIGFAISNPIILKQLDNRLTIIKIQEHFE